MLLLIASNSPMPFLPPLLRDAIDKEEVLYDLRREKVSYLTSNCSEISRKQFLDVKMKFLELR